MGDTGWCLVTSVLLLSSGWGQGCCSAPPQCPGHPRRVTGPHVEWGFTSVSATGHCMLVTLTKVQQTFLPQATSGRGLWSGFRVGSPRGGGGGDGGVGSRRLCLHHPLHVPAPHAGSRADDHIPRAAAWSLPPPWQLAEGCPEPEPPLAMRETRHGTPPPCQSWGRSDTLIP